MTPLEWQRIVYNIKRSIEDVILASFLMLDYDREAAANLYPRLGTKIEMNVALHLAAPASISFVRTCRLRGIWEGQIAVERRARDP